MIEMNKVYNLDCLEFLKQIDEKSIDLIVIDPPYNLNKDSWDKIDNYENWLKSVILELQRVLRDNGSFYMFHSEMEVVADFMQWFRKDTNFIFRQFIVWNKRFDKASNKGFMDGFVAVDMLRNYQQMAEYILYYTFQDETGLSKVMGSCVYPIREYIRNEIIRAKGKIVLKEINEVLGTATNGGGVASATLSLDKAYPAMMTQESYEKLQSWLNKGITNEYLREKYEDLREKYEDLREKYEDLRYTFNNQKKHHSVWDYELVSKKDNHITPKPLELIKNIILHSSKEGQIVLDCFMGTGTVAIACKQLNRNFIGCDNNKSYVEAINNKLSQGVLAI